MYRAMRRKDRQASSQDTIGILEKGEYGILATTDGSIPYAVPVNYVYNENRIYFHCAKEGHKLDNIKANPKVSFCVVGEASVLPSKFSTAFESAIAFGEAKIIEEKEEAVLALKLIISKYSPDFVAEGDAYIKRAFDATCVVRIDIEHVTGKSRDE